MRSLDWGSVRPATSNDRGVTDPLVFAAIRVAHLLITILGRLSCESFRIFSSIAYGTHSKAGRRAPREQHTDHEGVPTRNLYSLSDLEMCSRVEQKTKCEL